MYRSMCIYIYTHLYIYIVVYVFCLCVCVCVIWFCLCELYVCITCMSMIDIHVSLCDLMGYLYSYKGWSSAAILGHPRTLMMMSFQFQTVGKLIQQVTTGVNRYHSSKPWSVWEVSPDCFSGTRFLLRRSKVEYWRWNHNFDNRLYDNDRKWLFFMVSFVVENLTLLWVTEALSCMTWTKRLLRPKDGPVAS